MKQITKDKINEVYGQFESLFSKKIDCSEDPYNPIIGYNLKGATFLECEKAKEKALEHKQANFELKQMKCIETIADEEGETGAIWFEISNTGTFIPKFTVRAGVRYHFDPVTGKINAWHAVYDSFHLLNKGAGIKKTLGKVCDLFEQMSAQKQDVTPEKMESIGKKFEGLFAKKIDCSEDPFNPSLGFDKHGVTFQECMAAKTAALKKSHAAFQMKDTKCIA